MKIAITGITGFLGSHVADFFAAGNDVVGISTSVSNVNGIPVFRFDELAKITEAPEFIIHCHAAVASGYTILDKETLHEGNILATEKITARFPNTKHVYISTASVYGLTGSTISETSDVNPISAYASSKLEGEQTILRCEKSNVIRLSSLFGIGMKENTLIPNYVNQAIKNGQIEVWGNGQRTQNYFHVSDAVRLIAAVLKKDVYHQIFLGTALTEYSNLEIAKIIAENTSAGISFKNSDNSVSVRYDNAFTRNSLNWQPETELPRALTEYTAWKKRQF